MGFSSQAGHVAFMKQAVAGTFPAGFNGSSIAMKTRSGQLSANRDLLIPDPEIGGGRDIADAYLGAVVFAGDIEFYARFNALMTLLYAAFGVAAVKSPGGTPETHTLSITGSPTGGTFTITFGAETTAAIPYNATAAQVQSALEALAGIAPGDVYVTGGPLPTTALTLVWGGTKLGNVSQPTTTDSLTGGTTPATAFATTTAGTDFVGAASHTFIPSDAAQLPFLAVEERIGAGLEVFHYTDAVVNTLHFEAEANGYLMGTAGLIAKKQVAGASPIDAAAYFDNLPMVVGTNITVTYNSVSLPAKSFSFDLNNNFEDDDFRLGSFYVGDLTPKRREVGFGFTIREQDSALWRQAVYGTSGATEAGGVTTKAPLSIKMETYEAIPGATPSTLKYSLTLDAGQVALEPYTLEVSGDDIIDSDLTMHGLRPFQNLPIVKATVVTNKTTVN